MNALGQPFVVAHRGGGHPSTLRREAGSGLRENTLAAFAAAARLGARAVEMDARCTADGVVVIHHDAKVAGLGDVCALASEALPGWIPTLADALDACEATGIGVVVELKDLPREPGHDPAWPIAGLVAAALADRLGARPGADVLVSSFALDAIRTVRASQPAVPIAWLTMPGYDQHRALATAAELGCAALHAHESAVTEALIFEAHERGVRVDPWTVNDPARLAQLVAWGADGLITDDVEGTLAAIERSR